MALFNLLLSNILCLYAIVSDWYSEYVYSIIEEVVY